VLIVARVSEDGVVAVAWGMALNAGIAVAVPGTALLLRARRERVPRAAARPAAGGGGSRLGGLAAGVALPLALQAVYLVSLPFAAGNGVGAVTSLGFAYLAGSAVISVTASALALVTSVPLTRQRLDAARVALHVDSSSWLALVAVGATAGVFAVAGESLADAVLGGAYGDDVGEELGRLVVALAPWMVVTIGVSAAFPLVFVAGRGRRLPLVALAVVAVVVPVAWLADAAAGLTGLAVGLAVATGVGLVGVLRLLDAVAVTLTGLAAAALTVAAVAACAFAPPALLLDPLVAAVAGVAVYGALLALLRPSGLLSAWRYLRALQ
jgi:hypothetical protein